MQEEQRVKPFDSGVWLERTSLPTVRSSLIPEDAEGRAKICSPIGHRVAFVC